MKTRTNICGILNGMAVSIGILVLLAFIVLPASAFQLNGQDVSAATGETVDYIITLDEAPDGLAGFNVTVQLTNASVGEISAVTYPAWAILNQSGTLPADKVSLKAADMTNAVPAGTTGITIATLTFRADQAGTTPVTITLNQMDDDNGNIMSPAVHAGSFEVSGTPVPAPAAEFSATPTSGSAPLSVQFTSLSTGEGISSWKWDFNNDGVVDSTEENPLYVYTAAGDYTVSLNVTNSGGSDTMTKTGYISVTGPAMTKTKIGVVRSSTTWLLDASGDGKYGSADTTYRFGTAGDADVTGDWNGDGTTEIGIVRNNKTWLLDASGDGKYGAGDLSYSFGKTGDLPVTGDWDGDGTTEIGVVRTNKWLLDASGDGKYGTGDLTQSYGKAGDVPVTGDWDGDLATEIGVVRSNTTWLLDASGDGKYGSGDITYRFGTAGDTDVTGDWDADGTMEIGVVRNSKTWLLDASGDGKYGAGDLSYTFGKTGDKPVTGKWA
jgi:PKD repeat protein